MLVSKGIVSGLTGVLSLAFFRPGVIGLRCSFVRSTMRNSKHESNAREGKAHNCPKIVSSSNIGSIIQDFSN